MLFIFPPVIYAYVNGKILPAHKATISIFDRGLVLGDGLFETLRAVDFIPEFLSGHFTRLWNSAGKLRIKVPVGEKQLGAPGQDPRQLLEVLAVATIYLIISMA